MTIQGQDLRLFFQGLNSPCVAAATSCTIHVQATLTETSTKDNRNHWIERTVTGLAWDIKADAMVSVKPRHTDNRYFQDFTVGNVMLVKVGLVNPASSTPTMESVICSGNAIVNEKTLVAQNEQQSTYSVSFTGVGALELE